MLRAVALLACRARHAPVVGYAADCELINTIRYMICTDLTSAWRSAGREGVCSSSWDQVGKQTGKAMLSPVRHVLQTSFSCSGLVVIGLQRPLGLIVWASVASLPTLPFPAAASCDPAAWPSYLLEQRVWVHRDPGVASSSKGEPVGEGAGWVASSKQLAQQQDHFAARQKAARGSNCTV